MSVRGRYRLSVRGYGVLQALADVVGALTRPARPRRLGRFRHTRRDQPRARCGVIPGQHPVVDAEHDVRQGEIVVARRRQTLERETPVVGDVAGSTALERRQPGTWRGAERSEPRAHLVERAV